MFSSIGVKIWDTGGIKMKRYILNFRFYFSGNCLNASKAKNLKRIKIHIMLAIMVTNYEKESNNIDRDIDYIFHIYD